MSLTLKTTNVSFIIGIINLVYLSIFKLKQLPRIEKKMTELSIFYHFKTEFHEKLLFYYYYITFLCLRVFLVAAGIFLLQKIHVQNS